MISFAYTEEQILARQAAADFAEAQARPAARGADEAGAFSDPLISAAWALGLVQAAASGEAVQQPSILSAIVIEQLAYGDAALAAALAAPLGFVSAIAACGTVEQRDRWLPAFAGQSPRFAAVAHSQAGWLNGHARRTSARRVASGWRLDGVKAHVPLAAHCEAFVVTAEADEGLRAFIAPSSTDGVRIGKSSGSLGLRALQAADVTFENVFVPDGDALPAAPRRLIDASRIALAALLSGLARCVYDYVLPYTKQRVVHGEAIARKQAVAFKLADMHIAAQAMFWMTLRAAHALDAGQGAARSASLARRYAAEHGLKIADEGVQLFGGHGYMRDMPVEMWCRNARSLSVLDGLVGV